MTTPPPTPHFLRTRGTPQLNAADYLRHLFLPEDRVAVTLIKKSPDKKHTEDSKQRTTLAADLFTPKWQRFLRAMNCQRYEIYCGMNPVRPSAFGRQKADILEIRHLYLDFDEDGENALDRLLSRPDLPHPNFILNTSPHKYQTVWNVESFTPEAAELLLRGLARDTGADIAVTDIARVLRIPSFQNHKYDPPHLVTAHFYHPNVFTPAAFPIFPETLLVPRPTTAAVPRSSGADGRDHSRSGLDFGRTIGWLERGVSHDDIIQRLIAERPDKPNPKYYAAKTLQNAIRAYHANPPADRTSGRRQRATTHHGDSHGPTSL